MSSLRNDCRFPDDAAPTGAGDNGSSESTRQGAYEQTLLAPAMTTVRHAQSLCPRCRTRLTRAGERLLCPRCDRATRGFEAGCESAVVPSHASDWAASLIGQRLGEFRLQALLGEGAAGAVFLAKHGALKRRSAVKVLSPAYAYADAVGLRFLEEARTASSLVHPNVVTTHAVGTDAVGDGSTVRWIEQEFVPGRSLQDAIERTTFQPSEAARLLVDITAGLAAAHRIGLVHRDVKPDNILLTHCRTAKLGDFGLARPLETQLPTAQAVVGTPNYLAPEIFAGEEHTPGTDVFSLGSTFFAMLAGAPPFADAATTFDELSVVVQTQRIPSIRRVRPDVPLEIAECLTALCDRSPKNRPADGVAALQLVEALLGHCRDLETLVGTALRDEPCVTWRRIPGDERSDDRYEVDVLLPGGRTQRVFIEESDGPYSERNVTFDSICGPIDAAHFERVLRLNSRVSHGAIAIKPHEGRDHFVMVDTYPRGTLDAEEVRRSVWELAVYADEMEQLLTGDDRH